MGSTNKLAKTNHSVNLEHSSKSIIYLKSLLSVLKKKISKPGDEAYYKCIDHINLDILLKQQNTIFDLQSEAAKSLDKYVSDLVRICGFEQSTIIVAIVYLDKFFSSGLIPTEFNLHKSFLTSVICASKFYEDSSSGRDNLYYSKVGGLPVYSVNLLECEFLKKIDYRLCVDGDLFNKYLSIFEDHLESN